MVCTVAVSLCRPPCYPVQDRSPDGAGPLPAWHQPSVNEFIPPAGAVLCHLLPLCVYSLASQRQRHSLVSHTAGGEEAADRVCKDARSDASIRVSVGLEPPPPEPAGGRTHRHFYTGDPPPSSARAWEWRCPPARTVQARATARRPHRPGPGSDSVLPPGRCKPQVTRTRSALRLDGNPPPSSARAGSDVVLPPGRCKLQVTRTAGRRRRTRRPHRPGLGTGSATLPGRCPAMRAARVPCAGRRWRPASLTGPGRGATLSSRPDGASHR